ncbi:uncharacterized protein LOC124776438 [Schistocerca piceifrons]|uniref:uncharacterized protein LOC124776438 n=1 Tax=Schistocerca piceifrons TaxID=274613 RepID=UPI001F5E65DF|nr:uncharacterized protein LOC124776438 [Schistocerca piceifrons]XP_049951224.1 uncharacterized protein LOC126458316 [Schistocerca serialis cubense]
MANVSKVSILKFLEIALTITCIGLHLHSFAAKDANEQLIICGTFGGFLVILIGIFVGMFTGQPVGRRVDIFYSLAGCALFVAAGALSIQYYENMYKGDLRDKGLSKGALAIINGVCFLLDAVFSFRGE